MQELPSKDKRYSFLRFLGNIYQIIIILDGEGAPADAAGDANGEKKEKVEDVENTGGDAS